MPRIFILSGPDLGKTRTFEGPVRIGRTSDCEVVVHGSSISRVHAKLSPEGDAWVLVDLDSSNGIRLGSLRAKRFELSDGDVFQLGEVELRFREDQADPAPATPAAAETSPAPPSTSPEPAPAPAEPAPTPIEFADEGPDDDELFLEEDIDLGEALQAPAPPPDPAAPATPAPPVGLGTGGAPRRPEQSDERRQALKAAARGRTADVTDRREREILQFSTHRPESGAMTSDLSQHPLWVRVLAILLVLGVSATLFWFAFRGTSSLRGAPEFELDPGVELEDEY